MTWTLDPAHTFVGFSAKHLGVSTVRGQFTRVAGAIEFGDADDPTTGRGRVVIDVASLDSGNAQRDAHLQGEDFLDAAAYPEITFEASGVHRTDQDGVYRVEGDLTIRGVTRPVALEYEHSGRIVDPWGKNRIGGSLKGTINRADFGLRWNVALGGGNLLVGDRVTIEIDGELAEAEAQPGEPEAAGAAA